MFYIIRERNSIGGYGLPFHSWFEYTLETSKPSSKECFVSIDGDKDYLKKIVKEQGGLDDALEYLFNAAEDEGEIEEAFK